MYRFVFSPCLIKRHGKQPASLKAQPILRLCIHNDEEDVSEEESQLRCQVIRSVPSLTFTCGLRINRLWVTARNDKGLIDRPGLLSIRADLVRVTSRWRQLVIRIKPTNERDVSVSVGVNMSGNSLKSRQGCCQAHPLQILKTPWCTQACSQRPEEERVHQSC